MRFHDLRHYPGSMLVEHNGLVVTTRILGHHSAQTTMISYVHPDEANKRAAIEKGSGDRFA